MTLSALRIVLIMVLNQLTPTKAQCQSLINLTCRRKRPRAKLRRQSRPGRILITRMCYVQFGQYHYAASRDGSAATQLGAVCRRV